MCSYKTVIRYCIGLPRPVQSVFGEANSQSNQTRDNAVCPPFYTPTSVCQSPLSVFGCVTVMGLRPRVQITQPYGANYCAWMSLMT